MIGRLTRPLLRWARSLFATQATELTQVERRVGFDGFTSYLHDEKTERDRRYGTVYTVSEQGNAYLVRLEMPRRTPKSALKETWKLPDEMPDYDYTLSLANGVLSIRAGLHGESLRRVAYVSPSFPSAFMTRIEFACAVDGFKHRMRDKVLEIIIFKQDGDGLKHAA
jgi:HSP20 family molecular chaperone IbpA